MLLTNVEVDGRCVDVHVLHGQVARVAPGLEAPRGTDVVDGAGGALLPGLWDHHIHVMAMAAALDSVPVGPPDVVEQGGLEVALRAAAGDGWIRAIGYHDSVAGPIDRHRLDQIVADRPVRVQHRSGALWILNGRALEEVGLGDHETGRLFGADAWLRGRLPRRPPPSTDEVGRRLARCGVVGVTDMTPYDRVDELEALASSQLPQHVIASGAPSLAGTTFPLPLRAGPVKIVLADHGLPALDEVAIGISTAHRSGRAVAIHCVTREALVLALAAWDVAGAMPGDRIEHGAVVPGELRALVRAHGLTVVTQPGFVHERGDQYLTDVDPEDVPHLYPCRSLLEEGIPVAAGTDAPFGDHDPWAAVAAANRRRTRTGAEISLEEAVPQRRALELFLGDPADPGGPARRIEVGSRADLCLLDVPLEDALVEPSADRVVATFVSGVRVPL